MKKLTLTLATGTIQATSLVAFGLLAACGGGSSSGDEQDQPGDCPPALDQQGGAWTIVGATYQLDEDQAGLEDPLFPVDLQLQSRQLNLAKLDLQDIGAAYVDMYGVSQCDDAGRPGASMCITLYSGVGTGMTTTSATGVMPSTLLALAFADGAPFEWPVSPVLVGSYYDDALDMTVQLDGVSWVERVGDTVTQTILYKTYPGNIMVALPDHVVGEDDDCDGLIDEADELLPVDMLDPSVPAIHAGQVVLVLQRGSALLDEQDDAMASLVAVAESPVLGMDGQLAGVARVLQLAGEPALRLTLDDPLHPGFELALGLPSDEDGRFAVVVAARGARYALRGVRTGPVEVEGELVLLDARQPLQWRIGGGTRGD